MSALPRKSGYQGAVFKCLLGTNNGQMHRDRHHKQKDHLAADLSKIKSGALRSGSRLLPHKPNLNSERGTLRIGPPWELRHTLPPDTKGTGPGRAMICAAFSLQLVLFFRNR